MAISSTSYTLTPTPSQVETLNEGEETGLDWDSYLSIGLIRTHTKTDDVPGVSDELLKLYRAAAVEAAEFYSGLVLSKRKVVTEVIHPHTNMYMGMGMNMGGYGYYDALRPNWQYIDIRSINPPGDGII